MTQAALAEKLGLTRQEINKIVHGRKNITVQELKEIAAIGFITVHDHKH